jgi:hypothetical protein
MGLIFIVEEGEIWRYFPKPLKGESMSLLTGRSRERCGLRLRGRSTTARFARVRHRLRVTV